MTTTEPEALGTQLDALAAYAVGWRLRPLPAMVDHFGRVLLLDTLGALVGGTRYPEVTAMREHLGPGNLTSPDASFPALFRLGAASTWLDADSGGSFHPQGHRLPPVPTSHPAPHVLPALLHAAAQGIRDDELLRAFVLAAEVGMRFGTATSLRPGMHPHGLHGPVAAAVAGGLLRGLSPEGLVAAMVQALALPMAARLWQPMEGGTVRNAWTGLGAYYGARAAAEAETRTPMDQELASAALRATVTGDSDLRGLGEGLGSRWSVLDSYLKPYACARWIHPALDAMSAALAARRGAAPSAEGSEPSATVPQGADIERIEVDTFAYAASLSARDLRSDMHARFSLPTCLATLALDGELQAAGFLPDRLARPGVRSLANRVVLREDAAFSAALPGERPTTTTIVWRDGRQTSQHVRNARGNPDDPLPLDEVVAKFHSNVATVLPRDLAGDCETAILTGSGGSVLSRVALVLA
jgi:2-methylcitrate dehydratase PrpD